MSESVNMAWYRVPGEEQDVAIGTRVTLLRNVAGLPFSWRLEAGAAKGLIRSIGEILDGKGFLRQEPGEMTRAAAYALVEERYAGGEFVSLSRPHALFLNRPCHLAVGVCEEEHITIRAVRSGLCLRDGLGSVMDAEAQLDGPLCWAFDEGLGYLTASPADIGTALRAEVLLCLPTLEAGGRCTSLSTRLSRLGYSLRPLGCGSLYRLSHKAPLGVAEEEAIDAMEGVVRHIVRRERQERATLQGDKLEETADRAVRALGVLGCARRLGAEEIVEQLSELRLGVALGVISGVRVEALTALLVESMPASLSVTHPEVSQDEREQAKLRALLVRERLGESGMGA